MEQLGASLRGTGACLRVGKMGVSLSRTDGWVLEWYKGVCF